MQQIGEPHRLQLIFAVASQPAKRLVRLENRAFGVAHDEADGRFGEGVAKLLLALPQRGLGALLRRNLSGREHDAADPARLVGPGVGCPANPALLSVGVDPAIVVVGVEFSVQHSAMDRFPAIGNIGVELVVAQPGQAFPAAAVGFDPAAAGRQIDHVAIEHRDADRRPLDEHANLRPADPQRVLRGLFAGDVPADSDHANRSPVLEKDLAARGDPAHRPVARPPDPVVGGIGAVAGRVVGRVERAR